MSEAGNKDQTFQNKFLKHFFLNIFARIFPMSQKLLIIIAVAVAVIDITVHYGGRNRSKSQIGVKETSKCRQDDAIVYSEPFRGIYHSRGEEK